MPRWLIILLVAAAGCSVESPVRPDAGEVDAGFDAGRGDDGDGGGAPDGTANGADGDGAPDGTANDADGDGAPDGTANDADGDGSHDGGDPPADGADGDGAPDGTANDADGDGSHDGGDPPADGADGDGEDIDPNACLASVRASIRAAAREETGPHNCRFWGIVSPDTPSAVIEAHLIGLPDSIKNLGWENNDGWAVGHYPDFIDDPEVVRSSSSAYWDPDFDLAAQAAAAETPRIAVSHVRYCTSGLCNIPNPHPFERVENGRHFLMGHNGTISKSLLVELIDPAYLTAHPPVHGSSQSDWIDSELYFILMLETIGAYNGQVEPALHEVIRRIQEHGGYYQGINFFLSDGTTLWAYREGYSLYYVHDDTGFSCSALASSHPTGSQGSWVRLSDGEFITLRQDGPPEVVSLKVR